MPVAQQVHRMARGSRGRRLLGNRPASLGMVRGSQPVGIRPQVRLMEDWMGRSRVPAESPVRGTVRSRNEAQNRARRVPKARGLRRRPRHPGSSKKVAKIARKVVPTNVQERLGTRRAAMVHPSRASPVREQASSKRRRHPARPLHNRMCLLMAPMMARRWSEFLTISGDKIRTARAKARAKTNLVRSHQSKRHAAQRRASLVESRAALRAVAVALGQVPVGVLAEMVSEEVAEILREPERVSRGARGQVSPLQPGRLGTGRRLHHPRRKDHQQVAVRAQPERPVPVRGSQAKPVVNHPVRHNLEIIPPVVPCPVMVRVKVRREVRGKVRVSRKVIVRELARPASQPRLPILPQRAVRQPGRASSQQMGQRRMESREKSPPVPHIRVAVVVQSVASDRQRLPARSHQPRLRLWNGRQKTLPPNGIPFW
ncbi:MAG: hypothetical protein EBU59_05065 [Planctomycetia bacterium]|nr:hypothetical protein [Planctomycetia bacterium]